MLYSFPLYNYVNKDKVNILVFGYSDISGKSIDFAFEMAQVNGYKLRFTVVSDDADAKEKYLKSRPAFCKFFEGDDKTVVDSYGTLSFNTANFENIEDDIANHDLGLLQQTQPLRQRLRAQFCSGNYCRYS